MSQEIDYDELSFVISSQYRNAVAKCLNEGPRTPSEIAETEEVGIAHVSRALSTMEDRGLVELMVSEDRKKGRLYALTEEGEPVAQAVVDRDE